MKKNTGNQGSLYETQPLPVEGNMHNVTKPGKQVLGFFSASAVSRKRVFVDAIRDMGISYDSICNPYVLGQGGWKQFSRFEYPVYYTYIDEKLRILSGECVDCRLSGGSLIKPEFWPE